MVLPLPTLTLSHRYSGWTPGPIGAPSENGPKPCIFGLLSPQPGGWEAIVAVAKDMLQNAIMLGFLDPPVSSRKDMGQSQLPTGEGWGEGNPVF